MLRDRSDCSAGRDAKRPHLKSMVSSALSAEMGGSAEGIMRVVVDLNRCEANALCMGVAPEVFELTDDDELIVLAGAPRRIAARPGRGGRPPVPAPSHHDRGGFLTCPSATATSTTTRTTSTSTPIRIPVWKRMRDEQPLYYNDKHDFCAVTRWDDVEAGLKDHGRLISSQGTILELIKANIDDAARHGDLRRSAEPHRLPRVDVAGVHAAEDERHRARGAPLLPDRTRRARRAERVRHHRGARGEDADAGDRHAARHPRSRTSRRSATRPTAGSTSTRPSDYSTAFRDFSGSGPGHCSASTSTGGWSTRPTT